MRRHRRPCLVTAAAAAAAATVTAAAAAAVTTAAPAPTPPPATAHAAVAAGRPVTIPFPSPPAGVARGRLHTLPALQCRLHPTTPDGASPDPDAVANPFGRGGTGWVLRANGSAPDVVIPYGGGTCATPLSDAFQLEYLAAPDEMAREWYGNASTDVATGEEAGAEFEWAGYAFDENIAINAVWANKGPNGAAAADYFRPHPCASAGEQSGVLCADEVARLLTAQRNQRAGVVERHRGLFDVLAVSRVTTGVVLANTTSGYAVAALDRVSGLSGQDGFAIATYTTRDNDTRPVLVGEAALLSLGRGILADPSWLGASFPSGLNASVTQHVLRHEFVQRSAEWSMRHGSEATNSSRWLPEIASILCLPPVPSFVVSRRLCEGVEMPPPSGRASLRAGGRPVAVTLGVGDGRYQGVPEVSTGWVLSPPQQPISAAPCPAFGNATFDNARLRQPLWLLGRGSRELHTTGPGGETELALARNLSSCAYNGTRTDISLNQLATPGTTALMADLAQRYRRDLFHKAPPLIPVSNSAIILAMLVLVPEAVAVLLLLPARHDAPEHGLSWRWRTGLKVALVVMAGAVALVGIGYLDSQERTGHAWRAATVRTGTRIAVNVTEQPYASYDEIDYRGRMTMHTESLILVARTGYRPRLTRQLLLGCAITYALMIVAVLVQALAEEWRRRRARAVGGDGRAAGSVATPTPVGLRRRVSAIAPRSSSEGASLADGNGDGGVNGGEM